MIELIQQLQFTNTPFFANQKIYFHNRLAILIGKHCAGKTTVLELLNQGLRCQKSNLLVNNQKVKINDFQVMYLKDRFNLNDEIKLNKKSILRNHILKTINQNLLTHTKYQKVIGEIKELALAIEKTIAELFGDNLHALTNKNILLKFGVDKINLEHIIDELLEIYLFDATKQTHLKEQTFNQFLLRMVVFNILKTAMDEEDDKRPIIVLFDNAELYTSLKTSNQLNTILQQLLTKSNFYLVLASNSVEYLTTLDHSIKSLNWLWEQQIFHFDKIDLILQQGVAMHQFLLNNRYADWTTYNNDFDRIFDPKNDLPREWAYFYRFDYGYFLKTFFLDQVLFEEVSDTNSYSIVKIQPHTQQLHATYSLSLKSICLLASFFKHFGLHFAFSEQLLEQRKKICSFLPDTSTE